MAPAPPAASVAPLDDLGGMGALSRRELELRAALDKVRACKVDGDCTVVVVRNCGMDAVARTSAAAAEKAILAGCPTGGSGGPGPVLPKPKCVQSRCSLYGAP